jgi:branched-chain amino acid aminotransferase
MTTTYLYLNGDIIPADSACISPFDIGLLRGFAVFDLLRTVHGRPFLLDEHLVRLRASAAQLGLQVPRTDAEIESIIDELLERNGHEEATVRLVLTGGVSPDGMQFDAETPTFYILTADIHLPPDSLYSEGGKLVSHLHRREVPLAKTTNYLTMIQQRPQTAAAGALDLLYHDGEHVFEAASASVYFVRGNTILAPRESVLWGTIGSYVLELARAKYDVLFTDVTLADAFSADEVFLTSTTRAVVPITAIDDTVIGDGAPGPITRELMESYRAAVFGG